MSIVLRHQVEASEQAASEIESEISARKISLCYEVQSLLKGLIGNAKDMAELVEASRDSFAQGGPYLDGSEIREVDGLYRRLEATFRRAHELVQNIKSFAPQYTIEGEEKFHLTWSELRGIVCFSLDETLAASEQADSAEGRELTDFMHELHH